MKPSAIILAAGSSMRFGKKNKLLADVGGEPLICKAYRSLQKAGIEDIIVVTGPDEQSILHCLKGFPLRSVANPHHQEGMGRSISCGVSVLLPSTEAVFIIPADMPLMSPTVISELIKVFEDNKRVKIVCPKAPDGSQRNPVLWPKTFFSELAQLKGPSGGKHLLTQYAENVVFFPILDATVFLDIDTQEDLKAFRDRTSS